MMSSRVAYQTAGMRVVMQRIKEQASKLDPTTTRKDSSAMYARQSRKYSGAVESTEFDVTAHDNKIKHAEESLRTVMYLSCWGPN